MQKRLFRSQPLPLSGLRTRKRLLYFVMLLTGLAQFSWGKELATRMGSAVEVDTKTELMVSNDLGLDLWALNHKDPSSDALTVAASGGPLGLTFTANPTTLLTTGTTRLMATVTGGDSPYSYTFTGSGGTIVPSGLMATVSSIPAGVQTYTVVAMDNNIPKQVITGTVSVTVRLPNLPPTIANPISPQSATVGQPFTFMVPANTFSDPNGDALTYTASGLPAGITFTPPSTFSGIPTNFGVNSVRVIATDPTNLATTASFSLTINPTPLSLTVSASPSTLLTTGSTTLIATASGGTASYTYTFGGPGTIVPSGATAGVSGLPAGVQTFTVVAMDSFNQSITKTVSVTVSLPNLPPGLANPIPPQSATVGQLFTYTIPANTFSDPNGDALTFTTSGLPLGLSFTAPATISGTPTAPGSTTIRVTATDPGSLSFTTSFVLTTVPAALGLTFSADLTTLFPSGVTTLTAGASGGTAPYSYTFSGPGTITPNGNTATVSSLSVGVQTFTVVVGDAANQSITKMVSVTVVPVVPPPVVVAPIVAQTVTSGQPYNYEIPPTIFTNPNNHIITYTALGLPAGLTFTPPSTITGVPTVTGTFTVTIIATDTGVPLTLNLNGQTLASNSGGPSASAEFTISIGTDLIPLSMSLTATPTSILTTGSVKLSAVVTGGSNPYSYTFTGPGSIVSNVNSATVSGLSAGVQTFTVVAKDITIPISQSVTGTVSVTVTNPPPTGPATLTITSFNCFSTNGALSSVNFVVGYSDNTFSPALPPLFIVGVTGSGQLGTPYTFSGFDGNTSTLPIADNANRAMVYFTWNFRAACAGPVVPPAPTAPVAPVLPNQTATVGTAFSYVVPAFTGTAPISYSATGLPAGLSFDGPTRSITGVPSMTGVSTVTVMASNSVGTGMGQFTITVSASAVAPTPPAPLTITSFNCFSTNGALSSVSFVVGYSGGTFTPALPPLFIVGVTGSGQLGTPYTFSGFDGNTSTLPIADNANRAMVYFTWNFRAACAGPVVPPAPTAPVAPVLPSQTATVGTAFSYVVPAFTGTAPISYSATGLPAGLSFDGPTRSITGVPSMTGVSTVTVMASNSVGTGMGQFTITVSASAVAPTPPAPLTITSFQCFSTNGALSSVNFVVGYSGGTFTPALPPLFIVGVTGSGQLGTPYTFSGFDGNTSTLPIADNANRAMVYFTWNFRAACAGPVVPPAPTAPVAPVLPSQTATVGTAFSYVVPAFTGTAPITYTASGLPLGLSFDGPTRSITGVPSMTGVSTVTVMASNSVGTGMGQFTITVSASAVAPTPPAPLTITSFQCFSTNGALSSVNFVVGYSGGTFTPALPPLFILGVTGSGQLGIPYTFSGFDGNTSTLSIVDNANRAMVYFTWNFRAACANGGARIGVEESQPWQVLVLGNPVKNQLEIGINDAAGQSLQVSVTDLMGRAILSRQVQPTSAQHREVFDISQQSRGMLLLQVTSANRSQTVKVVKE